MSEIQVLLREQESEKARAISHQDMIRLSKLGILENCFLFLGKFILITFIFCKTKKKNPNPFRFWRTPLPLYIHIKTLQKKNYRCLDSFNQAK